jgi:hypothetical protein
MPLGQHDGRRSVVDRHNDRPCAVTARFPAKKAVVEALPVGSPSEKAMCRYSHALPRPISTESENDIVSRYGGDSKWSPTCCSAGPIALPR